MTYPMPDAELPPIVDFAEERQGESLVSIVTPHIVGREDELIRCMRRVLELNWPRIEHVIVSDRTDREEELTARYQRLAVDWQETFDDYVSERFLRFVQINESWRSPDAERSIGSIPFYVGTLLALGEFIGFCGDDDELLPDHVTLHVSTMRADQSHFSVSPVQFRAHGQDWNVIGGAFAHGSMDADGIMCHRDALAVANWSVSTEPGLEAAGDYRLVRDWLAAGLKGSLLLGAPTAIHNDGWLVGNTGRPDRPR